jgi:hypothetical protein
VHVGLGDIPTLDPTAVGKKVWISGALSILLLRLRRERVEVSVFVPCVFDYDVLVSSLVVNERNCYLTHCAATFCEIEMNSSVPRSVRLKQTDSPCQNRVGYMYGNCISLIKSIHSVPAKPQGFS